MSTPGRLSGILLPIFSLRTASDFGIGDFSGLPGLFQWLSAARQRMLMLLPLLPTAPGDPSPYGTRSAFGLNPLFIDLSRLPEWKALGGEQALDAAERAQLAEARQSARIAYETVFAVKGRAFALSFQRFEEAQDPARQAAFDAFQRTHAGWLPSYALFCALSEEKQHHPWWEWPEAERTRQPEALAAAGERLAPRIRYHAWLQWVSDAQWQEVRAQAKAANVLLCGDEPFIIGQDSVDCWCNPDILRRDARLGVPPDAFSEEGQDWGLPYFDFAAMERNDFAWLRARAQNAASYFDLRRVDHAVGYFRQYIRDAQTPKGRFLPDDEPTQAAWGERNFRLLSEGAGIVAEDLGVIPPFVREILGRLQLPGYKVMRWEGEHGRWHDPAGFPPISLTCTSTHDTDMLAEWWSHLSRAEKIAVVESYAPHFSGQPPTEQFGPAVRNGLLTAALQSGSDLCVLAWQDVLGIPDRINLPGSTSTDNWTWRMTQDADVLLSLEETRAAAARVASLTEAARR